MIIPDQYIQRIKFPGDAFENARKHYAGFTRISFEEDLDDYLKNGFVVSRPDLFALAAVVVHPLDPTKPCWFIRYAYGNIEQLYRVLPFYLPDILWCRNAEDKLHLYKTDRLIELCRAPRSRTDTPERTNAGVADSTSAEATNLKAA